MQITLNVPTEQEAAVAAWEDGKEYQITVKQTAPEALELVSVESEDAGETADEEGVEEGDQTSDMMSDMGGTSMPPTNPAIAKLAKKGA